MKLNRRQIHQTMKKRKLWTLEDMARATTEVWEGRLSVKKAAAQFGIPASSLKNRVNGKVGLDCVYGQKQQLLSPADENTLVQYCLYRARYGFPLMRAQVLASAVALYNRRHPEAPKKTLGQTWWTNFRQRHHEEFTTQIPDFVSPGVRVKCAHSDPIKHYFSLLQKAIIELGLRDKPQQIYSCEETRFLSDSVRSRVNANDHITVLACFNAAGEDVPPFLIYKGEYPGGPYDREGIPNALYGKSQMGNIDVELFHKWFAEHFLKFASKERPLLMVMNGNQSYLGPEVVQVAQKEGVVFLSLPPHSSHILQPLDVNFFRPLKAEFSRINAVSCSFLVSKPDFSQVLNQPYQRVKDRLDVVTGFRRCGLYPLDPDAIDWSQITLSGPQHKNSSPPPPQLLLQSTHVQIKEEPEEQSIKQEEEFSAVCVKSEESSVPAAQNHSSPESRLKQEIPVTSQIKEDPEEQSIKQEGEQLPPFTETSPKTENIIITNVVSLSDAGKEHCYSTDPFSCPETLKTGTHSTNTVLHEQRPAQKKTEDRGNKSDMEEQTDNSSDTDNDEDWETQASTSTAAQNSTRLMYTLKPAAETEARKRNVSECKICKKSFATTKDLNAHTATHTKNEPYRCSSCNKTFSMKRYLTYHMKTHTGEKPYRCYHCDRTFAQVGHLKIHLQTHTGERPYKCSQCDQAFAQKSQLQTHLKRHTGERPYSCSICMKTFSRTHHLKNHLAAHARRKSYSCSICEETFTRKIIFSQHMKRHAGEK